MADAERGPDSEGLSGSGSIVRSAHAFDPYVSWRGSPARMEYADPVWEPDDNMVATDFGTGSVVNWPPRGRLVSFATGMGRPCCHEDGTTGSDVVDPCAGAPVAMGCVVTRRLR